MPTIAEFRKRLQSAIKEIRDSRPRETALMLADELALIKARVINTGEKADGGKFTPYSEAVVPYWYHGSNLKNADFNVKNKQKELLKKKGYFSSYKDWREITNRVTAFKNFSFTNKMFHSIEPIMLANDENSTTYVFGSRDKEQQDKINWNKAQSGDFLKQSKEELDLLSRLNQQRIDRILTKHGVK